jgi:heme-degrading monooxygenase HmoA
MHVIIWEFRARTGREEEFERAYGPAGDWARLFERGAGYLGTELHRDGQKERRYVSIDRWATREAFEAFRAGWKKDYDDLDRRCEALTEHEAPIGWFSSVS